MSIEIFGVQIGAQHRLGKPDEWLVTYSKDGRDRLIHRVSGDAIQSSMDALTVAKEQLSVLED
jgi:hypothetical protein